MTTTIFYLFAELCLKRMRSFDWSIFFQVVLKEIASSDCVTKEEIIFTALVKPSTSSCITFNDLSHLAKQEKTVRTKTKSPSFVLQVSKMLVKLPLNYII